MQTIFPRQRFKTLIVLSNSPFNSRLFNSKDSRYFLSKFLSLAKMKPIKLSAIRFGTSCGTFFVLSIYCSVKLQPNRTRQRKSSASVLTGCAKYFSGQQQVKKKTLRPVFPGSFLIFRPMICIHSNLIDTILDVTLIINFIFTITFFIDN